MGSPTTRPGFVNPNRQTVVRQTKFGSNHWNQTTYELACADCGERYGANGCDIHIRRCPSCQSGKPGSPLE